MNVLVFLSLIGKSYISIKIFKRIIKLSTL